MANCICRIVRGIFSRMFIARVDSATFPSWCTYNERGNNCWGNPVPGFQAAMWLTHDITGGVSWSGGGGGGEELKLWGARVGSLCEACGGLQGDSSRELPAPGKAQLRPLETSEKQFPTFALGKSRFLPFPSVGVLGKIRWEMLAFARNWMFLWIRFICGCNSNFQ